MKKLKIGNVVKTKEGDNCIILDFIDERILVFNMSKMHPDKIKEDDIVEKIQESNSNTTIVINGKAANDSEKEEKENEYDENADEKFAELIRSFGKAAIKLGDILMKVVESDDNE